jgi:hypothetical protein
MKKRAAGIVFIITLLFVVCLGMSGLSDIIPEWKLIYHYSANPAEQDWEVHIPLAVVGPNIVDVEFETACDRCGPIGSCIAWAWSTGIARDKDGTPLLDDFVYDFTTGNPCPNPNCVPFKSTYILAYLHFWCCYERDWVPYCPRITAYIRARYIDANGQKTDWTRWYWFVLDCEEMSRCPGP